MESLFAQEEIVVQLGHYTDGFEMRRVLKAKKLKQMMHEMKTYKACT